MTQARWGVFLDRDGTLVRNAHHPVHPEQLVLYPTAGAAVARLAREGARLILVSNQSAVARGLLDAAGLRRMDRRIRELLRPFGVRLAGSFYCPHHPEFSGPCRCRKPATGMIEDGLRDSRLERSRCYLVGDTATDLEAAHSAGMRSVLVLSGHGRRDRQEALSRGLADHVTVNLAGAVGWILADRNRARY